MTTWPKKRAQKNENELKTSKNKGSEGAVAEGDAAAKEAGIRTLACLGLKKNKN